MTDISVRRWDQQITGKKRKYVSSDNLPQTEKYVGEEACPWDLKENIRSVISDWRQRPAGHSSRPVSSPVRVLRPSHYSTKKVPATEERYVRSLSLTVFLLHTNVAVEE